MGKFNGKLLTIYIAPSGVRVCEGENRNGDPDVSRFFVVGGVEEYFAFNDTEKAPEIVNMSGLVNAIVEECKNHNTKSRRVIVCSDCFGLETTVSMDAAGGGLRSALGGDIKDIGKMFSSKGKEKALPDQMAQSVTWGELAQEGVLRTVSTRTVGDKYMLRSLVQEFYEYGYEVLFVSGAQEILMNFRYTEPASFDCQGKIIFDIDVTTRSIVMFKDVPVKLQELPLLDQDSMLERISTMIKSALPKTGRSPRIYLAGSIFSDQNYYSYVINYLESEGYVVYDMFGSEPEPEPEPVSIPDSVDDLSPSLPRFTADFAVNVAMLMCPFAKTFISLTPSLDATDMFKKNSKAMATLVLAGSIAVFGLGAATSVMRLMELREMTINPSIAPELQNQISLLNTRQQSLHSTIQTLIEADTTVLELIKFVDTNQNDRVSVVSIDTRDMLVGDMEVDSSGASLQPDADVSGEAGGGSGIRESIVIRGYAKSGTEAVNYYDRLFKHGLSIDPVLNGVERYILPDGDEVYVFEIEIGGDFG